MNIEKVDAGNLASDIIITLVKEDYQDKYNSELKKHRSKAHMKGFRKGKTPMSVIKKMYGQSVLSEVVFNKLNDELTEYLKEEKLNLLGQPMPDEGQESYDFNPDAMEDYTFTFNIAESPSFELKEFKDTAFPLYKVDIPASVIDEEIMMARKRMGKSEPTEETIEENDILTIKAVELDGKKVKEKGWETDFTVMVNLIEDDATRDKILKEKVGYEFDFDIFSLEKDRDEAYVRKYFLNLDEGEEKEIGNQFRGKVEKVMRLQPAEVNEDFFKDYFKSEEITTEEQAREKIREELSGYYSKQATMYMNRKVMDYFMDEYADVELPDSFLKKWLLYSNDKLTEDQIENEYGDFRKNLQWTLIKDKLSERYKVEVGYEEIKAVFEQQIQQYMQYYPMSPEQINDIVQRMFSDQEQVNKAHEQVKADKIFVAIEADIVLQEEPIGLEDFKEEVQKLNDSLKN